MESPHASPPAAGSAASEAELPAPPADCPGPPSVVLADDDPLVRRVLRATLEGAGMTVVSEAGTCRDATDQTLARRPALLLLDLVMPSGDGLEVIERVRAECAETLTVVLTATRDDDTALRALQAGAVGCLVKDMPLPRLVSALFGALRGEAAISRRLGRLVVEQLHSRPAVVGLRPVRSPLTSREWEVLDLLSAEMTTQQIAGRLVISEETVRSHVKHILRKLGVTCRTDAVALAPQLRCASGQRPAA
jgi:two-component system, NarL family, response regulator LiaR